MGSILIMLGVTWLISSPILFFVSFYRGGEPWIEIRRTFAGIVADRSLAPFSSFFSEPGKHPSYDRWSLRMLRLSTFLLALAGSVALVAGIVELTD